ncbi:MAG: VWA domain-containing protein, partial [Anaerolineae bacterium]|nr:VWA domain-containing protein [Anaerolineae bacterium]
MTFTTPLALLLLIALPITWWIGRPRAVYRRGRDLASLALRTLLLLCLILALAGAQIVRPADKLAVVFLVDASDSMGGEALTEQFSYIEAALAGMRPDDEAGVIVFGGDALVERPMSRVRELAPFRSAPNRANTDLEEAISLGLALFPSDAARRMVILSDGRATVGDAEVAAQRAAAVGVEISTVSFSRPPQPEVQVTDVRVPAAVGAGQQFDIAIGIDSEESTPALLTVFASGAILYSEPVTLRAGANNYTLTLTAGESGFRDFRVQVDPAGSDGYFQNNQLSAFSRVIGPPRVLLITRDREASASLLTALTDVGLDVRLAAPDSLPIGAAALAEYDSILLDDIPATALAPARMTALQQYVRDLGGGLVVVGGPNSYAPGGYFGTPLEEALPVEMRIRDQQRVPQLTIAYVIDRSGSMLQAGPSGVENIELAKEAIIRSIEFLQPDDRAGVVSFDVDGYWIAEVQPVLDRLGLQTLVGTLRASGGTDILAGYQLAAVAMSGEASQRKHILLLTDGGASDRGLIELAARINEEFGVTTSTIAIGAGAAPFLDEMAAAGGGNYHVVSVVDTIPTIFTQETVLATRSYIVEGDFIPVQSALTPILEGITAVPALRGYVAATAKDTAQVVLRGPEPFSDPILAVWQYGLGRTVAFTSDAAARWAANWIPWEGYARFWSQAVRWSITQGVDQVIEARVNMEGERARVVVDARDPQTNGFVNDLVLTTSLVAPDGSALRLPLRQVAPGRYEAAFTPNREGAYFLRVGDQTGLSQVSGWVMSYSPEYSSAALPDALPDLAALTGGRALDETPEAVFDHSLLAEASSAPLVPWLMLAAALLLPFDVAVRRLLITRGDLARMRAALLRRREAAPSERLATLLDA